MSDSATPWIAACQASLSITNSLRHLYMRVLSSALPTSHSCCTLSKRKDEKVLWKPKSNTEIETDITIILCLCCELLSAQSFLFCTSWSSKQQRDSGKDSHTQCTDVKTEVQRAQAHNHTDHKGHSWWWRPGLLTPSSVLFTSEAPSVA